MIIAPTTFIALAIVLAAEPENQILEVGFPVLSIAIHDDQVIICGEYRSMNQGFSQRAQTLRLKEDGSLNQEFQILTEDNRRTFSNMVASIMSDSMIISSGSKVKILSRRTYKTVLELNFTHEVDALAVSKRGEMAFASVSGIEVFNRNANANSVQYKVEACPECIAFVGNSMLVAGYNDGNVGLYNMDSGKTIHRKKEHEGIVLSISVSEDEKLIATGGEDGVIKLFDDTMNIKHKWQAHKSWINNVFFADGKIVSGADDGFIKVWNPNGKLERSINTLNPVSSAAFSKSRKTLISGSDSDTRVRIYSIQDLFSGQQ